MARHGSVACYVMEAMRVTAQSTKFQKVLDAAQFVRLAYDIILHDMAGWIYSCSHDHRC